MRRMIGCGLEGIKPQSELTNPAEVTALLSVQRGLRTRFLEGRPLTASYSGVL